MPPVLRLLFDCRDEGAEDCGAGDMPYVQLALEPGLGLEGACARMDDLVNLRAEELRAQLGPNERIVVASDGNEASTIEPGFWDCAKRALSLLLYICAENREVDKREQPLPVRLVGGHPREASHVSILRCGWHTGEQLQRAREEWTRSSGEGGGKLAPHVRAAHWHHFWRGPRDGARELVLRWLAPIRVGMGDALPTTVRNVGLKP